MRSRGTRPLRPTIKEPTIAEVQLNHVEPLPVVITDHQPDVSMIVFDL